MLTTHSAKRQNLGRHCVSIVVVALAAVTVGMAIGPVEARAYFDPVKAGYDIDVHEVGVAAVYEDALDAGWLLDRHASLGPHSVRQGWKITTAATAMDSLMAKYNGRGLRPLVLAEFLPDSQVGTQQIPTDLQVATFCRDISERFGRGGSGGMTDSTAIGYIELGNETTLDPRFKQTDPVAYKAFASAYARAYAARVKTCAQNLRRGVKVLAQGPSNYATYDTTNARQTWIAEMYAAVPDLNAYRGGWTLHPYGPDDVEMDNLQHDLAGTPTEPTVYDSTGEYFLTEYGIATDDGTCLGHPDVSPTYNTGWPCRITYSQAAQGFETTIERWKVQYPRIRALWWYQIGDQKEPMPLKTGSNLGQYYYGLFQNAAHGRPKEPLKSTVERYIRDLDSAPIPFPPPPQPPPPPPPLPPATDRTRPLLSAPSLTPSRFRAARTGQSIVTRGGSTVSYRLSESAIVRFAIQRASSGRRSGARCVKPTRANRRARRCTRYRTVPGSFRHRGAAGANTFNFSGRLGNQTLSAGRYRLQAIATDAAANTSAPARARFSITRR